MSSLVFNLEDHLPDELVSSGNNWADNLGNKPNGPPGNNQQQMNGEDPTGVPNVAWNQHQRQGLIHFSENVHWCTVYNPYSEHLLNH